MVRVRRKFIWIVLLVAFACLCLFSFRIYKGVASKRHYHDGLTAVRKGDIKEAIAEFKRAIKLNPKNELAKAKLKQIIGESKTGRRVWALKLEKPKPSLEKQIPSGIAVINYTVDVEVFPAQHGLSAQVAMKVKGKRKLKKINLIFNKYLDIQQIRQGETEIGFERRGNRVIIDLAQPLKEGQVSTLNFKYSGSKPGPQFYAGDYISERGTYLRMESLWYPMPGELEWGAPFSINIKVPKGFTAVSSGKLLGVERLAKTNIFKWVTEEPAGGIAFAVGKYEQKRISHNHLEMACYLFDKDFSKADKYLKESQRIIDFYSAKFGAYPFKKFAVVEIPFFPGGYGSASFVMLTERSFKEKLLPVEFLAHEIGHQWWGQAVTPKGLGSGWLTEGFAQYSAILYIEYTKGREAMKKLLRQQAQTYYRQFYAYDDQPINRTDPFKHRGSYEGVIYNKGAYILHMLRHVVSDKVFFKIMQSFIKAYKGRSASVDDFEQVAREVYGKDLRWFFSQWLGDTGVPKYTLEYNFTTNPQGSHQVSGRIIQADKVFVMPVDLTVHTVSSDYTKRLWVDSSSREFKFEVSEPPVSLGLDEQEWILKYTPRVHKIEASPKVVK